MQSQTKLTEIILQYQLDWQKTTVTSSLIYSSQDSRIHVDTPISFMILLKYHILFYTHDFISKGKKKAEKDGKEKKRQ